MNQIQTLTPTTDADRRQATPWTVDAVAALFELPFNDLLFRAQTVHREHFDANAVQLSTSLEGREVGLRVDVEPSHPLGIATYATSTHLHRVRVLEMQPDED